MTPRTTTAKKAAPVKKTTAKRATPAKAATARKATPVKADAASKAAPTGQPALDLPDGELVYLEIGKVSPDPANLRDGVGDKTDFDELVGSIGQLGILQALLVRPDPDKKGSYIITAGHRRYAAAKKVGLKRLPCLVRDATEEERVEAMLVENRHRNNLTELEEAAGFKFLLERPGWTQRRVAERVGCDQGHVSRRVSLLKLPDVAQRALATKKMNIGDALELVRIADEPDIVAEVVKEATKKDDGTWRRPIASQVANIQHQRETAAQVAELTAEQERLGVRVMSPKALVVTAKLLTDVFGWSDDTNIKKHSKEPCHSVSVEAQHGSPRVVGYCTDPARHTKNGDSDLKRPDKRAANEAALTPAQRAEREATDLRRTWMRQTLALRTLDRTAIIDVALHRYIDDATVNERQKMCGLLGLEPFDTDTEDLTSKWSGPIDQYVAASETNLLRACQAFAFAQGEWGYARTVDHLHTLMRFGYQLHDTELVLRDELDAMNARPTTPVVIEEPLDLDGPGATEPPEPLTMDPSSEGSAADVADITPDAPTPMGSACKACRQPVHFSIEDNGWVHTTPGDCTATVIAVSIDQLQGADA